MDVNSGHSELTNVTNIRTFVAELRNCLSKHPACSFVGCLLYSHTPAPLSSKSRLVWTSMWRVFKPNKIGTKSQSPEKQSWHFTSKLEWKRCTLIWRYLKHIINLCENVSRARMCVYTSDFNVDIKALFEDAFNHWKPGYHILQQYISC